jgi:RNA polymerase sigma-70 factor (ECF subfamily)
MKIQMQRTAADGDEVVRAYADMVYKLAYSQVRNKTDADDIFQEVFFRYFKKNPIFESAGHQKAWLIRVTINCSKKHWSSAWRRKTVSLNDETADSERSEMTFEERGLDEALRKLPHKYLTVIHLFYYEGYSVEQMGEILKLQQSTIRTQLTRARALLRELLKGEEFDV